MYVLSTVYLWFIYGLCAVYLWLSGAARWPKSDLGKSIFQLFSTKIKYFFSKYNILYGTHEHYPTAFEAKKKSSEKYFFL